MDEKNRTVAKLAVIVGFLVVVAIVAGVLFTNKTIVSPVPEDSGIKIIFITPTLTPVPTESLLFPETSPSVTTKITPTPSKSPMPSLTP